MLNAVGREIPEEILERTGKEVFQGNNYKDGKAFQKASPKVTPVMRNDHDKMVKDIHEALVKCNAHDGMTVSFHHHFREGDLVVCMVMEEIHKMGFKNITLSASSLGKAHDALVPMIEDGTIVNIESSGVRGKIGDAISHGKLKGLATMRSHGGRVRAIETGETHVDIAFIGAPSCDEYGNCSGMGGKTNCGVLSYAYVDAEMADYVVVMYAGRVVEKGTVEEIFAHPSHPYTMAWWLTPTTPQKSTRPRWITSASWTRSASPRRSLPALQSPPPTSARS